MTHTIRYFTVVLVAVGLAGCGGGAQGGGTIPGAQTPSQSMSASRAFGSGLADLDPAAPDAPYNGLWGLEFAEGVDAASNAGVNSTGACSGTSVREYDCGEKEVSRLSVTLPSLSVSTPPTLAPGTDSIEASMKLGFFDIESLYSFSGFTGSDYVADGTGYASQLYWNDQITPPAADATHPLGTPITYKASLGVHYTDSLDCVGSDYFEATASGGGFEKMLVDDVGCGQTGTNVLSTTVTTSYGAAPLPISSELIAFVQTATDPDHTSSTSSFTNLKVRFYLNNAKGITYSTASGACYKYTGTCP